MKFSEMHARLTRALGKLALFRGQSTAQQDAIADVKSVVEALRELTQHGAHKIMKFSEMHAHQDLAIKNLEKTPEYARAQSHKDALRHARKVLEALSELAEDEEGRELDISMEAGDDFISKIDFTLPCGLNVMTGDKVLLLANVSGCYLLNVPGGYADELSEVIIPVVIFAPNGDKRGKATVSAEHIFKLRGELNPNYRGTTPVA